jgi:hypothetical protein
VPVTDINKDIHLQFMITLYRIGTGVFISLSNHLTFCTDKLIDPNLDLKDIEILQI